MLSYDDFSKYFIKYFKKNLPHPYNEGEIIVKKISKVDYPGGRDALFVKTEFSDGSPIIYISDIYNQYNPEASIDKYCDKVIASYVSLFRDIDKLSDFSINDNEIFFQLINTEDNKELIQSVPHRDFMGMTVVYRIINSKDVDSVRTALITHELANNMNKNEAQLFQLAKKNTINLMPYEVIDMGLGLMVATNNERTFGATVVLYDDVLESIRDKIQNDYWLVMTSTDEVIIIDDNKELDDETIASQLKKILVDADKSILALADSNTLSHNVYKYRDKQIVKY